MLKSNTLSHSLSDRFLALYLWASAIVSTLIIGFIVIYLSYEAIPLILNHGFTGFIADDTWSPTSGKFNLFPMLIGSLMAMVGAVLLAGPIGILVALFLNFYTKGLISDLIGSIVELLAGIPSVVFGFWGLTVLVPLIRNINPPGTSLLAGILILALMIVPTVALLCRATFNSLPKEYFLTSKSLGLSRFTFIKNIALPASTGGIATSLILSSGRAIGETMAVLMICGNIVQVPTSVFDPIRTLTSNIALEMAYAVGDHRSALFVSGLALTLLIVLLTLVAQLISSKRWSNE